MTKNLFKSWKLKVILIKIVHQPYPNVWMRQSTGRVLCVIQRWQNWQPQSEFKSLANVHYASDAIILCVINYKILCKVQDGFSCLQFVSHSANHIVNYVSSFQSVSDDVAELIKVYFPKPSGSSSLSLTSGFLILFAAQIGLRYDYVYPDNYLTSTRKAFKPKHLPLVPDNACQRFKHGIREY